MKTKPQWVKSNCAICGREFDHTENYTPTTCGSFECVQEAVKRCLIPPSQPYSGISYR